VTQVENRVNELDGKMAQMDQEIQSLYLKLRQSRGNQRDFLKQKLLHLLKRRKMMGSQQKNYFNHQMALDNVAFTQENIQNTMEMATAMKQGYQANMDLMKSVDIDQLADIKADMQDMMWECNQINEQLNYDLEDDVDEDDIDQELADIENDLKLQGMLGPNANAGQGQQNKLGGLTN